MGSFDLRGPDEVTLAPALTREAQHLLALLAFRERLVARSSIAGTLWPEASERHARASLRSSLWRLTQLAQDAVVVTDADLQLSPGVQVDLHEARRLAHRLLDTSATSVADLDSTAIEMLSQDCLIDWYEDWVLTEAEEWRQLRLHALAALALRFAEATRFGDALAAALAAIRSDPLRESAWASLMRVHLAEGNQSEAVRAFRDYRKLLLRELNIEPTPALRALIPESPGRDE